MLSEQQQQHLEAAMRHQQVAVTEKYGELIAQKQVRSIPGGGGLCP